MKTYSKTVPGVCNPQLVPSANIRFRGMCANSKTPAFSSGISLPLCGCLSQFHSSANSETLRSLLLCAFWKKLFERNSFNLKVSSQNHGRPNDCESVGVELEWLMRKALPEVANGDLARNIVLAPVLMGLFFKTSAGKTCKLQLATRNFQLPKAAAFQQRNVI